MTYKILPLRLDEAFFDKFEKMIKEKYGPQSKVSTHIKNKMFQEYEEYINKKAD